MRVLNKYKYFKIVKSYRPIVIFVLGEPLSKNERVQKKFYIC